MPITHRILVVYSAAGATTEPRVISGLVDGWQWLKTIVITSKKEFIMASRVCRILASNNP